MGLLDGKIAIVTGASSGIGRAAALLFAQEGASLVVTARRKAELDALVAEITAQGGEAVALAGDICDETLAVRLVALATDRFGGLDIAFNNAATTGSLLSTVEIPLADWRLTLDTNLTAAFMGAQAQLPAMLARGGGSLIFTSTIVGHELGLPGMAAYASSKAGLVGLARVIAAEYGAKGIRANALLPGGTDTPMGRDAAPTPEALSFVVGLHALKRIAQPEEIARAALFLASDASSFVTGSALLADGGVSINRA
ncbi:short-chain dehydrogenase/reductase SDR [Parvibaculum lavamentivorans DS-1]|uniref:Short-chain dehydrogenase/reductase SDR n=1 Tax=Parvibaculum lavamentivorans (strain DS-1 / DSM 13023 / NCIMB 13966) TaxID=402881 RepID=A7HTY8_PARL1|nr:SDR family oxidoreductase [Parvibaculum lavamentivorans]ABS63371.1 short-chain dehydrogenase/reductase SDR [Parvibaculum lavamentivorans DS-1]